MIWLNILWPSFALVALIFAVWFTMVVRRLRHIRETPPTASDFTDAGAAARFFAAVDRPAENLRNLFEMPVLFFALVPLLMIMRQAWVAQVILAWLFVALRAVHSAIHLGRNDIRMRFRIYVLSVVVLAAMWVGFFADTVAAAVTYQQLVSAGVVAKP